MATFVFDQNGTLLDTGALDPLFVRAYGNAERRQHWFVQLIQLTMQCNITGYYLEFPKLAEAALQMTEERYGHQAPDSLKAEIIGGMKTLPAFPDVKPGLERLRKAGHNLSVLTNSPRSAAEAALDNAGLRGYFDQVLSVEPLKLYKPAPEVYHMAAGELGITPTELTLVAAHSWDTSGAQRAGCEAAFLRRPGEPLDPLAPMPAYIAHDVRDLAEQIIELDKAA